MEACLEMAKVSKSFPKPGLLTRGEQWAVKDFSLTLYPGSRIGLKGPSGSGKSTIALMASGIIKPTHGAVIVDGEDTKSWTGSRWRHTRHRLQMLFQDPLAMLNPDRTLLANLEETLAVHSTNIELADLLDRLSIAHLSHERPATMSGGELRRASLARVLAVAPKILIADEPAVGLDMHLKAELLSTLLELLPPESALLLISHDPAVLQYCVTETVELDGACP